MDDRKIRVGITHGDICGVGYEVILKTFAEPTMCDLCIPVLYGSPKTAAFHRKTLNLPTNFSMVNSPADAQSGRLNMICCYDEEIKIDFGQATEESGKAAMISLQRAMEDYKKGEIDVLVTAPVNKSCMQGADSRFVGHTEYLEHEVGDGNESLMILMSSIMRVALVTTHVPVKEIASQITQEKIARKIKIFNQSLKDDFTISIPRVAVLSLNPHCGDNGLLGEEEKEIIVPAIEEMREQGIQCFGPFASDGFFGSGMYTHFDGVLAMYHDQGLTAFKALSGDEGVNFTAGLPLVRTSPDHGTAYDIAGKGQANENSFRQAVYTAIDVWRNREINKKVYANPMKIVSQEREGRGRRGDKELVE